MSSMQLLVSELQLKTELVKQKTIAMEVRAAKRNGLVELDIAERKGKVKLNISEKKAGSAGV